MRYFLLFMLGLIILPVQATTKVDVFSAEVLLDPEDTDAERKARSEGLQQVIIRASGDKNAINNEVIQKAVRGNSSSYLSQISYGDQAGNQTLRMVFNPPQIQSLLSQAQVPFWSDNRANLAVWIVEEGRYGRDILWQHSGSPLVDQLRYFSSLRGLPILVPVGDFDDVTSISPTDIWGGFLEPLSNASKRYPVDAVLVMRIQNLGDRDHIRWTLYDSKPEMLVSSKLEPLSGNASGTSVDALETVVDAVANYFAQKSSIKTSGEASGSVTVEFDGIQQAKSFFELEEKLKALQSVATVDVQGISGDNIMFEVHLLTSELEFEAEVLQQLPVRKVEMDSVELAPELDVNATDSVAEPIVQEPLVGGIEGVTEEPQPAIESDNESPVTEPQIEDETVEEENVAESEDAVTEEVDQNLMLVFEWIN